MLSCVVFMADFVIAVNVWNDRYLGWLRCSGFLYRPSRYSPLPPDVSEHEDLAQVFFPTPVNKLPYYRRNKQMHL